MDITKIPHGDSPPYDVNVVIEVANSTDPVKYEFNKDVGAVFVDRFVHTSMHYPCPYGFIPNTLSGDGDPVDVLVYTNNQPLVPGAVIRVRPLGMLVTEDEGGQDDKVIAVPVSKLDPSFDKLQSYKDLPDLLLHRIVHFFEHYKDLEPGKWVKVLGWQGVEATHNVILSGIKRSAERS